MKSKIDLDAVVEEAKNAPGIDVTKLQPGTEIMVSTAKSVYQIKVIDQIKNQIEIVGGKHAPAPVLATFIGSTHGGSIIRNGWIGRGLCLEVRLPKNLMLTTSPVTEAKVIGDGWHYDMGW